MRDVGRIGAGVARWAFSHVWWLQHGLADGAQLIENAVVNSDNDSFIALRAAFDHDGYEDWIANLGVDDETALNPMSDFPTYCPRTSARLWREMSEYLSMDTETSQWLSGLLASTSRSFIRDGIADEQVLVRNKAGWISEDGYYSTCDGGPYRHRWLYLCHGYHDIDAVERPLERGYGRDCKGSV